MLSGFLAIEEKPHCVTDGSCQACGSRPALILSGEEHVGALLMLASRTKSFLYRDENQKQLYQTSLF